MSDRRYRSGSRNRNGRSRRGRRTGLLDFWQNIMDDTYDFFDDTIDRVRDDDYDDLEDEVEDLKEAVTAISAKLDRLLAQGVDVREAPKAVAKTTA